MLPLDDPRWQGYEGGYRCPYDASRPLRQLLEQGATPQVWEELFEELHHQGDVGPASYAAVPWLVEFVRRSEKLDWQPLSLIALIELQRPAGPGESGRLPNPPLPDEIAADYFAAIRSLAAVLGSHPDQEWSELVLTAAAACIALGRGQSWFARVYFELDRNTAARWFADEFGWDLDAPERG